MATVLVEPDGLLETGAHGVRSSRSVAVGAAPAAWSVAFAGACFGWPYYAGVAAYLQANAERLPLARIYGASSGAVVAALLACEIDVARDGLAVGLRADAAGCAGRRTPFFRPRTFLAAHVEALEPVLAPDAHVRATGRLFVTVRRVPTLRRMVVSSFPTRADLIDALAGAVAVPGLTVRFVHSSPRLGAVIDGGPGPAIPARADRVAATTVLVGIDPRAGYHIAPARPFTWRSILSVEPDDRRRAMYDLGRFDAARFFARHVAVASRPSW